MKKIICFFLTVLVLTSSAYAAVTVDLDEVYSSISFPSGYKVLYKENLQENIDYLEELGDYTPTSYYEYMEDNFTYATAISEDKASDICFLVYETDDSQEAFDMANLSEEELAAYEEGVRNENFYRTESFEFIKDNRGTFAKITTRYSNAVCLTYITIKNGSYYVINLHRYDGLELTKNDLTDAEFVFKSLEFTKSLYDTRKNSNVTDIITVVLTALLCVASFAILAVVIKRLNLLGKK